jgi:hypothetical protein
VLYFMMLFWNRSSEIDASLDLFESPSLLGLNRGEFSSC